MLRAEPTGPMSWDFRILRGDRCYAHLDLSWWAPRAKAVIDGVIHDIAREGLVTGRFTMHLRGVELMSAVKPSAFQRRFEITHGDRQYELEAAGSLVRKFVLRAEGVEIGAVRPVAVLSRQAIIDLPPEVPLDAQVFISWLVLFLWKRQNEGG